MNARFSEMHASNPPHAAMKDAFATQHHLVIAGALPAATCQLVERYALLHLNSEDYFTHDEPTQSLGRYADAMGESMLIQMQPRLESIAGRKLIPTYSFLRFYTAGSCLRRHTDRDACEISATITLGYSGGSVWPLGVQANGADHSLALDVGDMLVYRGIDLPHWRDPLQQGYWLQLFLHFVDAAGPYQGCAFDDRNSIGPNNAWVAHVVAGDKETDK